MADNKFEVVGKPPVGDRIEIILGRKKVNLGAWWMDNEGTVGHDCLHHLNGGKAFWYSRVARGYDPVNGCFRSYCMSCGADAPEEVFNFANLRKFGETYKDAMKR